MNKLVKRGIKAYNIFLKNKLAASLMMFIPGVMMAWAALNGNGNDTKSLPLMILLAGAVFSFWSCYRLGYIKSSLDKMDDSPERKAGWKIFFMQVAEASLYLIIAALGVYLLVNESLTNKILNMMAGFFTTLNGVFGAINAIKGRANKNFRWKFMLFLTLFELGFGAYFIISTITSSDINIRSYLVMGIITAVAGAIEVASCLNAKTFKDTLEDGREIIETMKGEEVAPRRQVEQIAAQSEQPAPTVRKKK
ncbi:MAG: DUF308 domain-containing protein [Candidatus Saccharibacteria bacterium]|nr:DUF308 domain-containing protein [Candidatus Saccharibacteria bacterium]